MVENTSGDSFDLFYGLFMYNKNSLEMLERLDFAFEDLRKQLMGRLHDVVREQLFDNAGMGKVQSLPDEYVHQLLLKNGQNGSAAPVLSLPSNDLRCLFVFKGLLYNLMSLISVCHYCLLMKVVIVNANKVILYDNLWLDDSITTFDAAVE